MVLFAPVFFAVIAPFSSIPLLSSSSAHASNHIWKTQAQSKKAESKCEREKKREIAIIYSGNTRSEIVPFPHTQDALGGLSRGASVINRIRREFPVNFSIDVGNMLNSSSHPLRVELAANYYGYMNFNAIAPGADELALVIPEFPADLPVVVSNLRHMPESGIADGIAVERDGYRLYVMNLIGRSLIDDEEISANISTNMRRINSLLDREEAKRAHLRIAVVHADLDEIKRLAQTAKGIDIIIAGSLQERFDTPLKVGSAIILSAGSQGRFIGSLSVRFDGIKSRFTVTNKLHPVYQNITPDANVEKIIKSIGAAVTVDKAGKKASRSRRNRVESLPFLTDRNGTPQVFVKRLNDLTEHHISEDLSECRLPVISADGSLAAFIFGPPQNGSLRVVDLKTLNGRTVPVNRSVTESRFASNNFLYFIASDSANPKNGAIYKTRMFMDDAVTVLEFSNTVSGYRDLSVSPDRSTLLFCAVQHNRWQIFAVDSSAAAPPAALTNAKADHRYPRFSPNGKFIAYLTDRGSFGGKMDLWIMELKHPNSDRQITFHANVSQYSWSEDSKTIYFSAGVNVTDISSITIKNNTVKKLIVSDSVKKWNETAPQIFEHNRRPKLIYTRSYTDGTRRLRMFDFRGEIDNPVFRFDTGNEWSE